MRTRRLSSVLTGLILSLSLPMAAADRRPHRAPQSPQAKPLPCVERCYKSYDRCLRAAITMACKNDLEACMAACDDE